MLITPIAINIYIYCIYIAITTHAHHLHHRVSRSTPGYEDDDGLDDASREAINKLGFNHEDRAKYRKAKERRVEDAKLTKLRVGPAKRYQPIPTLKELAREMDMRFKPMFGAGAASKLTSYVSCTVQFDNASELAGFAAYLKGYAFAEAGSSQSLMR